MSEVPAPRKLPWTTDHKAVLQQLVSSTAVSTTTGSAAKSSKTNNNTGSSPRSYVKLEESDVEVGEDGEGDGDTPSPADANSKRSTTRRMMPKVAHISSEFFLPASARSSDFKASTHRPSVAAIVAEFWKDQVVDAETHVADAADNGDGTNQSASLRVHSLALQRTEYALMFLVDMLESAASCSLLSPAERKACQVALRPKCTTIALDVDVFRAANASLTPYKMPAPFPNTQQPTVVVETLCHLNNNSAASSSSTNKVGTKRARSEPLATEPSPPRSAGLVLKELLPRRQFIHKLGVEYLLKALATAPAMVQQYLVLSGATYSTPEHLHQMQESIPRRNWPTLPRSELIKDGSDLGLGWLWDVWSKLMRWMSSNVKRWATPHPTGYATIGA